ncbi:E3 ubiquitin-protein ligase TRIM39 [Coregonus clupeaformis]|uniref:E3 ubiquitin-protein ligase TRIM39 n=1 Tax=Coregonus clupeaformis TaxID=59861 RepID=UPI001BE0E117|nr:E3 ubiquitin-protein ligase TRIM39 [Coregonus clupeaformis]
MSILKKSILKEKKIKFDDVEESATQDSSIGAVRWELPEDLQTHNSAPTSNKQTLSSKPSRQQSLKDMRSLHDCVRFITQWKQQVEVVCKLRKNARVDQQSVQSLEQCRKLILQWAEELKRVDTSSWIQERGDFVDLEKNREDLDPSTQAEQRIMEWAKELQSVTERCGLMRDELTQMLRRLELNKKKLVTLLPFLEFITWSLLKEEDSSTGIVPQLWLAMKQRTWKTETPKYIPNSVWNWICSASVDVNLDPMTNHPWLLLSDDHKKVQEAHCTTEVDFSTQRYDGWPCVLGWEGMSSGRHYWEVTLANNGYWRVGLTTATSKRHGRFPMTPAEGYWALWRSTRQLYACTKPETSLPLEMLPRNVGIYLDFEEGQISFYNVETRAHIYTFTDNFKEKLYPLFAPLDGRTLITISSPKYVRDVD